MSIDLIANEHIYAFGLRNAIDFISIAGVQCGGCIETDHFEWWLLEQLAVKNRNDKNHFILLLRQRQNKMQSNRQINSIRNVCLLCTVFLSLLLFLGATQLRLDENRKIYNKNVIERNGLVYLDHNWIRLCVRVSVCALRMPRQLAPHRVNGSTTTAPK